MFASEPRAARRKWRKCVARFPVLSDLPATVTLIEKVALSYLTISSNYSKNLPLVRNIASLCGVN